MRDLRPLTHRAAEMLAGVAVAAVVGALTLLLLNTVPFDRPSWLPESFKTVLVVGCVLLTGWLLLRRATGDRALWLLGTAGPAFLASTLLGLLLHGTPHYLFGLGGDQINRVTYLTRFADSAAVADPFYADAAPFYPPGWFWAGGRLAALFGVDGWEFYKPFAIVTMAVAGAVAFVAWRWLVPARLAVLFALVTTAVGVHTNAYEPYSWILICLLPQVVVTAHLLCARVVAGRAAWSLVVTLGVYLGLAALAYTLIAGFAALLVGAVVLLHVWLHRSSPAAVRALVGRLATMAAISAAIALLFWHRYLLAVLGGAPTEASVANDFAPETGAQLPLPMFELTVTGVLCLVGLVWVVVTVWPAVVGLAAVPGAEGDDDVVDLPPDTHTTGSSDTAAWSSTWPLPAPDTALVLARSVAVIVVAVFGWYLASGLRSLGGSTLLPFRLIPVITLALALAGVVGVLALARWALAQAPAASRGRAAAAAVVVAGLAAVQLGQFVSEEDAEFAAAAFTTSAEPTDVMSAIDEMTGGRDASDLVLLTTDPTLSAYRPYFSFQAPSQAYATPMARFWERLVEIRQWSGAQSPAELAAELDTSDFRAPDVMVLARKNSNRWVFRSTINAMPLKFNNAREDIAFSPQQFDDPELFSVREVGDKVVVVRR